MTQEFTTLLLHRWIAISFGLWAKLAPMVVALSVTLKLASVGVWTVMPWGSVAVLPALGAMPTLALLGGWLALMTHDWNR
ncbi:hypothetical protein [Burkholderia sp. Ac-20365]|uniref:hypothetical protein n=1 Tax=Burkholderia sp. Ac-20365 TaxID=2703897 RepID=UPI00197B46A8|nr:hypothetical protein [Burkholderia sp. Ac-20365]MBN3761229.1 hypothetical protein [Burkholderia sp. Ac-20365]